MTADPNPDPYPMNPNLNNRCVKKQFMKTEVAIPETSDVFVPASLHHLVNRLSDSLAPAVLRNKSLIINNVPEDICSEINEPLIASVLSRLMNVVISHTENSCIRISAKMFGNVVLIHVKDDGCLNYDSISHNLTEIQAVAEKMGGFVGFTSYRNRLTTIAFSFINMKEAA
jgi:hypothetical protein